MHPVSHILSGWCAASLVPQLTPRQRLMCMIAASVADLDAISIFGGQQAYWHYHHRITHALPFGLLACAALTLLSGRRISIFLLYLALFHLHLIMDMFGSGPGWPIYYLWPFSNYPIDNRNISWKFYSWQNLAIATGLLLWTVAIALVQHRTPLEAILPDLDRRLLRPTHRAEPR